MHIFTLKAAFFTSL